MRFEDIILGEECICKYNKKRVKIIGKDHKDKDLIISVGYREVGDLECDKFSHRWGGDIGERMEVATNIDDYRWVWVNPDELEELY